MTIRNISLLFAILITSSCTNIDEFFLQQDVDFIRNAVIENYPYLQVHLNRDNLDWSKNFTFLRNHPSVQYKGNNRVEYLSQFLKGLNGHAHLIDIQSFPYYSAGYLGISIKYPEYSLWAEVLTKPSVLNAYGQTISSIVNQPKIQPTSSESYSFTKQVNGDVLYLKIPTFDGTLASTEGPKIVYFLKNFSRSNRTIIIDIRGNGGGSDLFWTNYLVRPLITAPLEQKSTIFYKGGELSIPFLKAKKVVFESLKTAEKSFGFNGDINQYKYFSTDSKKIEPSGENIPFKKLIVLMNRNNFSSSESFVSFCKATKFATCVGRNSGGDGIGFDPILIELPYSHLLITLPICAAINGDGTLNYEYGTTPDFLLEENVDTLEYVVKHRDEF